MGEENNLFSFMETDNKKLTEIGDYVEQNLFADPHSVLVKARLYCETLSKMVMKNEEINEIYDMKQVERVQKLKREGIMTEEVHNKFELIRRVETRQHTILNLLVSKQP